MDEVINHFKITQWEIIINKREGKHNLDPLDSGCQTVGVLFDQLEGFFVTVQHGASGRNRIIERVWSRVCYIPKSGSLDNLQIQQLPAVTGMHIVASGSCRRGKLYEQLQLSAICIQNIDVTS